ncbi:Insulin-degrading enzyme [Cavenderia fasciculata]|uniref:Insulin-degrading enzyme n=1 Tax=Cavenderia fasciculata TaxID=261658 RepID=F4PTN0_CACFS|nr:Insulin-degrading enzyme [Cavenderia fasciculata]EGG21700.1 Insulin-degrading enzyme [Cavenderia fasciculata]|eukprot:XP_004359550.1 Insulin-degrading enzyme [Cavenderia fasciculata]
MTEQVIIEKSPNDDREYKYLTLDNMIKVVLVSDPQTDKSGAALSVNVGSLSNPPDALGLAHFLEHMLFLGTEKYPNEKEFIEFIQNNNGLYNGSTSLSETSYHFKINYQFLEPALDRFSSFFVNPLFNESATLREVNAVDSEHKNNVLNDWRRRIHIINSQFDHPLAQFATGSLETLKPSKELRESVIAFYDKYYSANQMSLCIIGRESIDELEQLAVKYFASIKNKNIEYPRFPALSLPQGGTRIDMVPASNSDSITFAWPMTNPKMTHSHRYKNDMIGMISHFLGHESRGSLFSVLKAEDLAYSLVSGPLPLQETVEYFYVWMNLTEKGLKNIDTIIAYLYQAIAQIDTIPQYLFNEVKTHANILWENLDKAPPMEYSKYITSNLCKLIEPKYLLKYPYLSDHLDTAAISEFKSMFTYQNMVVLSESKSYQGKTVLIDKYYGVEFSKTKVTEDDVARWKSVPKHKDIYMPKENPFLPTDFAIRNEQSQVVPDPEIIHNEEGIELHFAPDHQFNSPKAFIKISYKNPYEGTCNFNVMNYLLKKSLKEVLNEDILYYSQLAGISSKFLITTEGISHSFSGFSDTLIKVVVEILKKMSEFDISDASFERIQELVAIKYSNQPLQQPTQVAQRELSLCTLNISHSVENKLAMVETITKDDFVRFVRNVFCKSHFKVLMVGNYTKEEALVLPNRIKKEIKRSPVPASDIFYPRRANLGKGSEYHCRNTFVDPQQPNSVALVSFTVGPVTLLNTAIEMFMAPSLHQSVFSELRTAQQLGYIVYMRVSRDTNVSGLQCVVQSDKKDALYLHNAIVNYLPVYYKQVLEPMSDDLFQNYIQTAKNSILEKRTNMKQQTDVYWSLFKNGNYNLDNEIVEQLSKLTLEEAKKYFRDYVLDVNNRQLFSVQMFSGKYPVPTDTNIVNDSNNGNVKLTPNYVEFRSLVTKGQHLHPVYELSNRVLCDTCTTGNIFSGYRRINSRYYTLDDHLQRSTPYGISVCSRTSKNHTVLAYM